MFLFSKKLIKDSLATGKAPEEKLQLIHWGPDLAFYDHILQVMPDRKPEGFISTGKENRECKHYAASFLRHRTTTGLVHRPHQWKCKLPTDY